MIIVYDSGFKVVVQNPLTARDYIFTRECALAFTYLFEPREY